MNSCCYKRNNVLISYVPVRSGDRMAFDGCFQFDKRVIWSKEQKLEPESGGRRVILFLDEFLRAEEERDFVSYAVKSAEKKKVEGGWICRGFLSVSFVWGRLRLLLIVGLGLRVCLSC